MNLDDVLNAAIIKTTVFVGEELLKDHAILLPSVHDSFTSYAKELLTATNLESEVVEVTNLVTSRWIFSNLTANLKHHMSYSCRARKYGTLLYRSKSNLLSPLAQALWSVQNLSKASIIQVRSDPVIKQDVSSKEMGFDELNDQIHSQIKILLEKDAKSPFQHHDLDIDQFLKETNSEVWEAVCSLTRSVSERQGTSKVNDPSSLAHHTKKLCHFFCFALCSFAPVNDAQCHYMYFWQT